MSVLLVAAFASQADFPDLWSKRASWHTTSTIRPFVVDASHNVRGYEAACVADGKDETFWLVPGGQRMEMMSRHKWVVFDLGDAHSVTAVSLLGTVSSFAPAHLLLDCASSAQGPWRRVHSFRGLKSLRWERINLAESTTKSRYYRLFIRREGHASFRHAIHGVFFHTRAHAIPNTSA
mmetsp:Transcript_21841/g.54450  ORF Transcript_21841/g.54450 Transcript_21841/m.54450 type:complete len:178 (-) Transcript_21841:264-797(-)